MKVCWGFLGTIALFFFMSQGVKAQNLDFSTDSKKQEFIMLLYLDSMIYPEIYDDHVSVFRKNPEAKSCIRSFRSKMAEASTKLDLTCSHQQYEAEAFHNCIEQNPPEKLLRWSESQLQSFVRPDGFYSTKSPNQGCVPWTSTLAGDFASTQKQFLGAAKHETIVKTVFQFFIPFIENYPCEIQ